MKSHAFRFVLLMSVVSLFGDMTYEGARSVIGPFFAVLGASGTIVGVVAGFSELVGYGLRYYAGIVADRTKRYWDFGIAGYAINLLSVPALAFARTWPVASIFVVGERFGRGLRKPATNAMVSYAGSELGRGWVFGFREAMDQTGATLGPLIVAGLLFVGAGYTKAFGVLAIPAVLALAVLSFARTLFPIPASFERKDATQRGRVGMDRAFWLYVAGASCLAAGFADFALISYHFARIQLFAAGMVPIVYAAAMLAAAIASPLLGKAYDRFGPRILLPVLLPVAAYAPLAFLGGRWIAVLGVVLWGVGMGVQDTVFPAVVSALTPAESRASALGAFDAAYGIAWFIGSAVMGVLYDHGVGTLVLVSLAFQVLLGLPLILAAGWAHHR
ncbi:MAG TPA: MFS transporter [Candidatus Baltobacteraceae bacterium]|nr:MFS transporter [Candidatus Baltobacteraceae bacterium]